MSSTSDNNKYPTMVKKAVLNDKVFNSFKQDSVYREILEHINGNLGEQYLNHTKKICPDLLEYFDKFKQNDSVGKPILHNFGEYGEWSPSTFRYVNMLAQMIYHFGDMTDFDIVEVGGGYGGQAKIITDRFKTKSYKIYDLDVVTQLQTKYANILNIPMIAVPYTKCEPEKFDLYISNYAFSECSKDIQDIYINNIMLNSKRGFIMWNHTNGSYSVDELVNKIPGMQVFDEYPNSKSTNKLLIWNN